MTKQFALAALVSLVFASAAAVAAPQSAVRMEIAKVYRTGQFVNVSKPVATYSSLKKPQDLKLDEAVAANENQISEVKVQDPKSFHVNVSAISGDSVTVKLKSQIPVYAIRFDAQGNAAKPQEFKGPLKLAMNETIEFTSSLNPNRTAYSTSFRMKIVPAEPAAK